MQCEKQDQVMHTGALDCHNTGVITQTHADISDKSRVRLL